jgi:hypothetical protein
MSSVVKFPYSASRRVHSRKPRKSHNGTPEERAVKAAAGIPNKPKPRVQRPITGDYWDKFLGTIERENSELMQDFMADAWKLLNRWFRKL